MVPSIAIPTAITATMAVPGFNGISSNPIMPNISTMGITDGIMAIAPPFKDVNMIDIRIKMSASKRTSALIWETISFSAARFTSKFSPTTCTVIPSPETWLAKSLSSSMYLLRV